MYIYYIYFIYIYIYIFNVASFFILHQVKVLYLLVFVTFLLQLLPIFLERYATIKSFKNNKPKSFTDFIKLSMD